jgi:protein-tyrosine phosphatase
VSLDPTRIRMEADPHTRILSGVTMHGNIPFAAPFISEIAPNLWQGGCTNGLILPRSFRHIVSLYPWESYKIKHELISNVSVRMLDGMDEDMGQITALAGWVNACRKSGPVLAHCQAGLNRSSLVVASALMQEGMTADATIALIREKRSPACLCNPAFEDWLRSQPAKPRIALADHGRLYLRRGSRAHLSPPFGGGSRYVLCAAEPTWPGEWLGTGSQEEYDRAASLPICRHCKFAFGAAFAVTT